ncbi:MAG: GGDEF domain-containing phosphodiesterase [Actinomycetota bacterium]|nr:GGDEF domain-containing phosphodiesterase [Actinomycetota bacterium]
MSNPPGREATLPSDGALLNDRLTQALGRAQRSDRLVAVIAVSYGTVPGSSTTDDAAGRTPTEARRRAADIRTVVVARLVEALRPADTVAVVADGDLVVVCEDLADELEAVAIAERVVRAASRPVSERGTEGMIRSCVGMAIALPDSDGNQLVAEARTARDHACQGDDLVGLARPVAPPAQRRLSADREIRRAIEQDELRLWYQPTVSLRTGRLAGFEALLRWQHPERGLLPPSEVVPVAERTGTITEVGAWAIDTACRELACWQRLGAAADLSVSVNLSARQLDDPTLLERVRHAVEHAAISPEQLTLELTESVLLDECENADLALADLAGLGVMLAVDDFGTGWASLAYLHRFPVHAVKVDASFTSKLVSDPGAAAITEAIVNLAHALDLVCTAEGVATAEQLAALRRLGCDRAQGFLIGEPIPAQAACRLITADRRW